MEGGVERKRIHKYKEEGKTKLDAEETIKANLTHRHAKFIIFYSERDLKLLENKDDNGSQEQYR